MQTYSSPPSPILNTKETCAFLKRSRSSVFQALNPKSRYFDPTFPKPFKLGAGAGSNAWRLCDLNSWVDAKAANVQPVQTASDSTVASSSAAAADSVSE